MSNEKTFYDVMRESGFQTLRSLSKEAEIHAGTLSRIASGKLPASRRGYMGRSSQLERLALALKIPAALVEEITAEP